MITIDLKGDKQLVAKLDAMPAKVHMMLLRKVTFLALTMEAIVKQKLSGPVLKVRTGNLRDSIFQAVSDTDTSVTGKVAASANTKYAAIHEYGGVTSPHDIVPTKAQALAFMIGGKQAFAKVVHHPGSRIPERSYMRSTLKEMTPEIIDGLKQAVSEGLK